LFRRLRRLFRLLGFRRLLGLVVGRRNGLVSH
jgi:hypothetical protein